MTISRERTGATTATGHALFGTRDGRRDDRCPQIALGAVPQPGGGATDAATLYIICEPVEPTARAVPVGASVMAAIRDIYGASDGHDPVAALAAAIEAANDVLYQKNRAVAPGLRVVLGVTCLLVRDDELIICQVPPTQAILAQDGTPIALPELESWRGDYQPRGDDGAYGLGMHATVTPRLFRATLEEGDLLTLCSSNLAAVLAEDGVGPLIGDDPEAGRDYLADLAARHRLDPAYAAVIAPPPPSAGGPVVTSRPGGETAPSLADDGDEVPDDFAPREGAGGVSKGWLDRSLREMRERTRVIHWPRRDPSRARIVPLRGREGVDQRLHGDFGPPSGAFGDRQADDKTFVLYRRHNEGLDVRSRPDDEANGGRWSGERFGGTALADGEGDEVGHEGEREEQDTLGRPRRQTGAGQALWSAAAFAVLIAGAVRDRIRPVGGRGGRTAPAGEGRAPAWPIGSLERWDRGRGLRLPHGRWTPLLIVAAIGVFAVVLVVSVRGHRAQAAEDRFTAALDRVAADREAAVAAPDRLAARGQLLALRDGLTGLETEGRPGREERVAAERAALATAIDRVDGVERLGGGQVQLLAPPPVPADGVTGRPQLVIGGGQQFLLINGTAYAADGRGKGWSRILAKGDSVAGVGVGQLLGLVWRVDSLFAFDERYGYVRDAAGAWSALPVAVSGRKALAADSFGGNLYLLEAERGQITKLTSGDFASPPQPWSSAKVNGELTMAVDLTIDKNIYVLLSDGRTLDFFAGELKGAFAPAVVPPLAGATAIHAPADGKGLYLADPREGRIVRLSREGAVTGIFKAAEGQGAPSFSGAREIAVDESAGIAYILADGGLLRVQLPPIKQ
ncbi:MAG: hypothetical protein M3Q65_05525 [Chloroflexota bacterium]|nr:hypothetical protein [Chloroflexota bacterium]